MNAIDQNKQLFYQYLLQQNSDICNDYLQLLPKAYAHISDKTRYAQAPLYQSIIDALPKFDISGIALDCATIGAHGLFFSTGDKKKTTALLKQLMPWRKGGYLIGGNGDVNDENAI